MSGTARLLPFASAAEDESSIEAATSRKIDVASTLGGYPAGCDCSNFRFIARFESDREKWAKLEGINLFDGQRYLMEVFPLGKQDKVVAETFRIILHLYLRRPESKSLAPDGTPCIAETHGLLKGASVVVGEIVQIGKEGEIVPIGKEMDCRCEQGEEMDLLDSQVLEYRAEGKLVSADHGLRERMLKFGVRELMRKAGLSQKTVYAILRGQAVRQRTLEIFQRSLLQT